jgi:predicted nucleotidyltransferase
MEPKRPEAALRQLALQFHPAGGVAPQLAGAVLDELVRRIAERFSPDKLIHFGSRARGDAGPDSDIDLLVLFSEVADPNKRAAELYASLVDFPRPMDIVVSTNSRFERYRNVVNTVYWPASREGKILYERAA